ncbi:MAG: peptidylprolyl isomerase [Bacteroidetes bacterium]|nr:peptidylprolyl isomerase [Bacteroidota bacterium]
MRKLLLALFLLMAFSASARRSRVVIVTDSGRIVLELYDETPKHRDNMKKLAKEHFYDSLLFHRVIPEFVIQGGDPDSKHAPAGKALGDGDLGYRIPAEINDMDFHKRGAVGAARDNNPEKASSGCQFYIVIGRKYTDEELDRIAQRTGRKFTPAQRAFYKNIGGTPHLDGNYTVFGEVVEGMNVADKIAHMQRDKLDRPLTDIRMKKVYVQRRKFLGIF